MVLAIKGISSDISEYCKLAEGKSEEVRKAMAPILKPLEAKLDILRDLYRLETGTYYG